jgi:transcriptional regulator with XRE-family HTH domain
MACESEDISYQKIGLNLKNLRKKIQLTQSELGNLLGVSFQQVQKYEKGINRIPALQLYFLQKTFNVPFETFFESIHGPPPAYATQPHEILKNRIKTIRDNKTAIRVLRMLDILLDKTD